MSSASIQRLRRAVRDSGTPLISSLGDEPRVDPEARAEPEHALAAAGGPRVAANREDVEIAVAAVDEGYRLHYASPRALQIDDDDLRLLAGDRLYALGLARLAAIGDMTAIAELADVISLGAQAQAGADPELADAAWQAAATAIGWGPSEGAADAKARARAGDPAAAAALREAARAPSGAPGAPPEELETPTRRRPAHGTGSSKALGR
jgi:hypothetical protein